MLTLELGVSPLTNITYHNISVLLCLNYGQTPLDVHVCDRQLQVNTSTVEAHFNSLFVPYPRSGLWFISLRSSCYFHDRTLGLAPETIHPVPCEFNTTSVILNVKSSACQTTCSKNGKCNQFVTGGLIFSTCTCKPGWKGWSCDDGSQVEPEEKLMFSFLLLTLSNLMFIPAVILATCKGHFAEALVYTITMVSSGLYHACDSQCDRAFCVVSPNLLQFGDFYSALLAFWVTLVSLGNLPVKLKGFLHFFGGIFIAFVVEYDRTSLWAFAIPAGVGVTIMLTGWVTQCIKHSSCYPSSKHWACSILPGLALSVGGLVVYGFFETRDNYAITHSIWHGSMAIALLFLVPTIKAGGKKRDNEDYRTSGTHMSRLNHVEWRPRSSFKFLRDDVDML
ncbi:Transmembrane protein 8B [Halotydeus destructor]|nr:Transmembrane protein 8B [Halotydeus destructor]